MMEFELRLNSFYVGSLGVRALAQKLGNPRYIERSLVYHLPGNVRIVKDLSSSSIIMEKKEEVVKLTHGHLFSYVESNEIDLGIPDQSDLDKSTMRTYRNRRVFDWDGYEVHITNRTQISMERITTFYSVEVEFSTRPTMLGTREIDTKLWTDMGVKLMHMMYGSLYTKDKVDEVRKSLADFKIRWQTPIDITWKDVTYNNLIRDTHGISYKADGIRVLCMVLATGVYIVTNKKEVVPIDTDIFSDLPVFGGVWIADCELMDDNTLVAFDMIYAAGKDVSKRNLQERRSYLPDFPYSISVKEIEYPVTVDEFFDTVTRFAKYPHSDGLILSRLNQEYSLPVDKWKPIDLLTVDFFVNSTGKLGVTGNNGELVYPDDLQYDGQDRGMIVEMLDTDAGWKPMRIREDKSIPNHISVYNSIRRIRADPITLEDLTGQTLKLMRKYHNRMKRCVYKYLDKIGVKSITDIGSGKFGDLSSWLLFPVINAVEPSPSHYREARRRATTQGFKLVYHDRDMEQYSNGNTDINLFPVPVSKFHGTMKTDALTLFNSLTFIGESSVEYLISLIERDGRIVVMVMDGKIMMSGHYTQGLVTIRRDNSTNQTGKVREDDSFGNLGTVYVDLEGTATANAQVENLVDVDVLINFMLNYSWVVDYDSFLDKELLMGHDAFEYSKAQRLLVFRYGYQANGYERVIYGTLGTDERESIDTPYGTLIRVGVESSILDPNASFYHSILYVTDPEYRRMSAISKRLRVFKMKGECPPLPVYAIPPDSWKMVSMEGGRIYEYNQFSDRQKGIVMFKNEGMWEPLIKTDIYGKDVYIW